MIEQELRKAFTQNDKARRFIWTHVRNYMSIYEEDDPDFSYVDKFERIEKNMIVMSSGSKDRYDFTKEFKFPVSHLFDSEFMEGYRKELLERKLELEQQQKKQQEDKEKSDRIQAIAAAKELLRDAGELK